MLTFIKLGGSLITDKRESNHFRPALMQQAADEIAAALQADDNLQLLIGHGSGSFGHVAANKHGTIAGVVTLDQWRGFAEVATAAAELNFLVAEVMSKTNVPVWRLQPSASAWCEDGKLVRMSLHPIRIALEKGLVPLVYGDVALDEIRGGTIISTEAILSYLASHLPVTRILLLGEVQGVLDANGDIIKAITPGNISEYESALGGSAGTDVTGGMLAKVQDMLALALAQPGLQIRIMDGRDPGLLRDTLLGKAQPGTLLHNPPK